MTISREQLIEIVTDRHGMMQRCYGEKIVEFRESSGFKRAIMARRYPEIADYVAFLDAQQSVVDARRSAQANEGNIVIF